MVINISIDIYGERFKAKDFINNLKKDKIAVKEHLILPYALSIENPNCCIGFQDELVDYEKWYVDFLINNFNKIYAYGGKEISIFYNVYFLEQCNFEILDKNLLKKLKDLDISFPVSVYHIDKNEMKSLLVYRGCENSKINSFFKVR